MAASLNVAIESVEFLLAGALSVLREEGRAHLPELHALENALRAVHGEGSTPIDALVIARGMIASGEVNPAFWEALGVSGAELAGRLEG